jgi:branched-subunit amino acid ABC-type transport system permease component
MHVRFLRAALTIPLMFGLLVISGATAAIAADAANTCGPTPDRGESENSRTIHIQGCLRDKRGGGDKPVPGVTVEVFDSDGELVADGETDEVGLFDFQLPGKGDVLTVLSGLNGPYEIKIDVDTLPTGTALQDPKRTSLTADINTAKDQFYTFPIDDAPKADTLWDRAIDLTVGGIVFSLLLAMAALGLSLVFGTTGLTNFAHGELITFGALVAFLIDARDGSIMLFGHNATVITGVVAAAIFGGLFGWAQDRVLWRPLRNRGTGLIAMMIVSIGLSIFLRNVFQYVMGGDAKQYSQFATPSPWEFGPFEVTPKEVGVAVFALIVLVIVTLALRYSRLGKATRAVADNPALAASSGINVDRVISIVWVLGASLAALSGVLLGMTQGYDFQLGFKILLLVFAGVTLGGLGTIWGALVGSLIIGLFIELSTLFLPVELKFVGALVVLILVLLVRPQGILGKAQRIG